MMFMNTQRTRVGKLQLELDRQAAAELVEALRTAGQTSATPETRASAAHLLAWVCYRAARRWGPGGPWGAPGAPQAAPGTVELHDGAPAAAPRPRQPVLDAERSQAARARAASVLNEWR